ncbi:MAG: LptF/LptG family permease [marine benthic group bacterium]|nr:LptF/LptG family permease [Gemmatimonadota bacterium]MCL7979911.1 LptF/LptG family permease [Gemmatimonadota bacterium]MCL7984633.1 LptF/LptG family permease [Gemmatimonadota bacterium]MCL7991392.1 LptF/LptG family permease [Gemmatimonadota bacterium]
MKILDRYVLRQFFRILLVCVIGVPFIFIIINLTDQLDNFLADDLTSGSILAHYLYQVPYYMLLSFPIAALLAAVFTVSSMTRHFEISAAKAGGVSFYRIVTPLLVVGMVISVVALGLTEVVPAANRKSEDALGDTRSQREGNRISFIYRGEEGRYYYIRRLAAARGEIADILVAREGAGYSYPGYDAAADEASWDAARGRWVMESGRLRYFPERERTIEFRFEELWQREFTETPDELLARPKGEEEMGYAELGRYIEALERSGADTGKLRVEQQLKLAFPFTCFIIVLFGLPLANSSRKGGASLSIGIALGTTILFLILVRVAQAMGSSGVIAPVTAAWLANAIFLVAGLLLFTRVKT